MQTWNHIIRYIRIRILCCKTIYWEIKCWNQKSGFVCGFGDKSWGFHYYARLVPIVLWCCSNKMPGFHLYSFLPYLINWTECFSDLNKNSIEQLFIVFSDLSMLQNLIAKHVVPSHIGDCCRFLKTPNCDPCRIYIVHFLEGLLAYSNHYMHW